MQPTDHPYGPREKLSEIGPRALHDEELLAVLLGTGTRDLPAPLLAQSMLSRAGGPQGLLRLGVAELAAQHGIGPGKATRIAAALELGRRASCHPLPRGARLSSSEDVFRAFGPELGSLLHEELWALAVDSRSRVISRCLLARGGLSACPVRPADVFRPLLREGAAGAVLIHNHPSGTAEPSADDLDLTTRIARAGELLGIRLLDHVIVTADGYFSCLDAGLHPGGPGPSVRGRS
ncbi:MAG: hypothetical protein RL385_5585 [Pseudomonadota bacterium]|jgi:DNA repair protein RadC